MLLTHFTSPASNQAVPDPMFGAFYSELAQMGDYPVLPRRVAVSSGSGHQLGLPFSAGSQLILWEYRSWALDITGNIWALHNLQPQTIFYGEQDLLWPLPDRYLTVTVQPTWPWDNAPGGTRNSLALLDSVPAPYGDIHALHPTHCFVPTVSALGLDVTDPFYNIAGDADLYALSPFDSLYYPAENQDHVDVTPENFEWLLYEVAGPLAAPVVVARVDAGTVQLVWSSIAGARSYHIQFAEDPESWPVQYSVTADTAWTDPDAGALKRFYRVTASLASAGTGSQ